MCLLVVAHWHPCHHQRLAKAEMCASCLSTLGSKPKDCSAAEVVLMPNAQKGECPICLWQQPEIAGVVVRSHVGAWIEAGDRNSTTMESPENANVPAVALPANPVDPMVKLPAGTFPCVEHDFLDLEQGEMLCVVCGSVEDKAQGYSECLAGSPESKANDAMVHDEQEVRFLEESVGGVGSTPNIHAIDQQALSEASSSDTLVSSGEREDLEASCKEIDDVGIEEALRELLNF